jgi:hypothetical protein
LRERIEGLLPPQPESFRERLRKHRESQR